MTELEAAEKKLPREFVKLIAELVQHARFAALDHMTTNPAMFRATQLEMGRAMGRGVDVANVVGRLLEFELMGAICHLVCSQAASADRAEIFAMAAGIGATTAERLFATNPGH